MMDVLDVNDIDREWQISMFLQPTGAFWNLSQGASSDFKHIPNAGILRQSYPPDIQDRGPQRAQFSVLSPVFFLVGVKGVITMLGEQFHWS